MNRRCMMIFSHPGHELTVLGMLQRFRPHLLFLTRADSCGSTDREDFSYRIVRELGLQHQTSFLGHSEFDFYEAVLEHNVPFFESVLQEILECLDHVRPDDVLGDAFECYNINHDVCRLLIDRAVLDFQHRLAVQLNNYEVPLASFGTPELAQRSLWERSYQSQRIERFRLTAEEIQCKRELLKNVSSQPYISSLISCMHPSRFDFEVRISAEAGRDLTQPMTGPWQSYEDRGRESVAKGKYGQVIHFDGDFVPLVEKFLPSGQPCKSPDHLVSTR